MSLFYKNRLIIILIVCVFLAGCAAQAPYLRLDSSLQKDMKTFNGVQYVPLTKICDSYRLKWKWDPFINTATIENRGSVVLRGGSDRILINGSEARLGSPVVINNGSVYVPVSFVRNGVGGIVEPSFYGKSEGIEIVPKVSSYGLYAIRTIALDPGHGGKDPGAIGGRLHTKEKDLTLAISKKIKVALEGHGINVIMTRDDNTFIPLPRRTEIANKKNADLFISVHVNASRTRSMNGFECYYLSEATNDNARAVEAMENASLKFSEGTEVEHSRGLDKALWDMTLTENRRESAALANHICNSVENSFATRVRGTKTARFYVLKGTRMPAVLVETAYISNKNEELKLRESAYLDRIVDAIVKGILEYKDEYERTDGYTKT